MTYQKFAIFFVFLFFGFGLSQKILHDLLVEPPLTLDKGYDIFHGEKLQTTPDSISLVKGETTQIKYVYTGNLSIPIKVYFNTTVNNIRLDPNSFTITPTIQDGILNATGLDVTSRTFIDIYRCEHLDGSGNNTCPFNATESFVRVKVIHSHALEILVSITGWIYFAAWSISFYPQIWLNWKRGSVEGLNFDYLVLNIIGFTCYAIYNWMMYFDQHVQDLYLQEHERALIPVLTNDIVFATHALIACIITGIQCLFYERGQQKISYICMGWGSLLVVISGISFAITLFNVINWLQFIMMLSYIKMAVTLSKYFPQVILNVRRKSTIGWSIGNVLLDFTGGSMDITQMVLQASNTDDWSGFYGNPVKFGLGLVSMIFDIVFMIQHYILYRHSDSDVSYDVVNTTENSSIRANPNETSVSTIEEPNHY
jgi:LCT (Lysosomal Cystine Transporter) family transporter